MRLARILIVRPHKAFKNYQIFFKMYILITFWLVLCRGVKAKVKKTMMCRWDFELKKWDKLAQFEYGVRKLCQDVRQMVAFWLNFNQYWR